MKNSSQKLIFLSFVLAVLAAAAVFIYLQSLKAPKEALAKTTILVATETIPPRTLIVKKMIKEIEVSNSSFFSEYSKDTTEVIGKYTKETIFKNEGFHRDKILSKEGEELTLKIDNNHRAISISVAADAGVSKLIKPGDFVDIIVYLAEKKEGEKTVRPDLSKNILQNIEVLAIDKLLSREDKSDSKEKMPTNFLVTVSVPTNDLEKMVLAESIGSIKLALRPLKNDSTSETKGATWEELTVDMDFNKTEYSLQEKTSSRSNEKYINYTVKQGDSLKIISNAFYGDSEKYSVIKAANNIQNENLILTGEVIKIPIQEEMRSGN